MTTAADFSPITPVAVLTAQLDAGTLTSRDLLECCLQRIEAGQAAGDATFISVDAARARDAADAQDALRRSGVRLSPIAGLPISIKDLFDVEGEVTRAGARVMDDAPAALSDAFAVARLRQAGAILLGRTNMSEFAFSGLGLNPHFGTPLTPWHPEERRVAGGSSSGAGASVARGMAVAALGTDTGGSIRIPAAFCGVTGFKPTARRVSGKGAIPLSTTLDSFGPLAASVACCAAYDSVLSGERQGDAVPRARPAAGLRLAVLRNFVDSELDTEVSVAFESSLRRLSAAGAVLKDIRIPVLDSIPTLSRFVIPGIEAFAFHRERVAARGAGYDRRVLARIMKGADASAADYLDLLAARSAMIGTVSQAFAGYDAVLMPGVAIIPPKVDAVDGDDEAFARVNTLTLRNPSMVNFIDGCALSIPCHQAGEAPVGLGVVGLGGWDASILALGQGIEAALA